MVVFVVGGYLKVRFTVSEGSTWRAAGASRRWWRSYPLVALLRHGCGCGRPTVALRSLYAQREAKGATRGELVEAEHGRRRKERRLSGGCDRLGGVAGTEQGW